MSRKVITFVIGIISVSITFLGLYFYNLFFSSNTNFEGDNVEIKISRNSSYDDVLDLLKRDNFLSSTTSFDKLAEIMSYKKEVVPAGRYLIKKGSSNRKILSKLRSGNQDAVKVTINNVRTLEDLSSTFTRYLDLDSLELLSFFKDSLTQNQYAKTNETFMTLFLPDTYEMFWTVSKENLVSKMTDHSNSFWKKNEDKLKNLKMSSNEVYTLASIVEKESNLVEEKATVAGVYLNRIKTGMKLQADPTVVFALQDFALRRVLLKHLEYDSPYNTYMYTGLPPGPICMPSMSSINASLNPENHEYIFFCAKPGYNSGHNFAVSLPEHSRNAVIYQKWLSSEGIK